MEIPGKILSELTKFPAECVDKSTEETVAVITRENFWINLQKKLQEKFPGETPEK